MTPVPTQTVVCKWPKNGFQNVKKTQTLWPDSSSPGTGGAPNSVLPAPS